MTRSGTFLQWAGCVLIAVAVGAAVVLSGLIGGAAGELGTERLLLVVLVLAAGGLLIGWARRRHCVLHVATSRKSFEIAAPRHELDRIVRALRVERQLPGAP